MQIRSKYEDRSRKDPHRAKHDDIYVKMASVMRKLSAAKDQPFVRFEGCPVSVAEQVLALVHLGGIKNPYVSSDNALAFTKNYLMWRSSAAVKRLTGTPYQKAGVSQRGEAKPELDLTEPAE